MRDFNPAERLLSLFTSTESAAGIVGDLSEERAQRGSVWFWRQVVSTAFALCRGAWFTSPGNVLLLVLLGMALGVGLDLAQRYLWNFSVFSAISIHLLIYYSGLLLTGAVLVTAAPRLGMAACVLLAALRGLLSLSSILYVYSFSPYPRNLAAFTFVIIGLFLSPLFLCLGGAIVRRRWALRHLRRSA